MKLKYYLKGFGAGVLFATILLSISFLLHTQRGMTDAEIMARARELGMETAGAADKEEQTDTSSTGAEQKTSEAEIPTTSLSESISETSSVQETEIIGITEDTIIVIEIRSGMSSETVSRILMEAGVVESASEINRYLVEEDMAKYIRVGTFELSKGMSFEDIVKKICW